MKISIITVSFNSVNTIDDTFMSVFSQDYNEIEYIVVDGGSNDGTLDIVEKYESKIAHIISEPDKGIYDAMNKGISIASGDIIGILNSDDIYPKKDTISSVVSQFKKTKCQSIYGDLQYVNAKNINKVFRYWQANPYNKSNFKFGWMPPHPTFFVLKSVYDLFGTFNLNLSSSADYEIMFRFLYKHEISVQYLPKVLVKMRVGGQSNESIRHRLLANKEDVIAWRINGYQMPFYTRILKPLLKLPQLFKKAPRI